MDNELITIIVPVYNVELYLKQFLESLFEQTYNNLEIILIDDGSTDSSGIICDEYSRVDDRLVVFHQNNMGQAAARNKGIEVSNGKYIAFVDADDILDKKYIQKLYELIIEYNADISMCLCRKFGEKLIVSKSHSAYNDSSIVEFSREEALENLLYRREINNSPWCKLLKREMIGNVKFPVNIGYEDLAVVYKFINNANRIVLVRDKLYFYRQRIGSTMRTSFNLRKMDRAYITEEIYTFINENHPNIIKAADNRKFISNLQAIMDIPLSGKYKKLRDYAWENIKNTRNSVLFNEKASYTTRIMAASSYLGKGCICILGKIYRLIIINILRR